MLITKPRILNGLTFSDKSGRVLVKEDYFIVFTEDKDLEAFIQDRYAYYKRILRKELFMAQDDNETVDELGIRKIFELTGDFLGLKGILTDSRKGSLVEARRHAIGICVERHQLLTTIGKAIGQTHSNIIYHRDRFNWLCEHEVGYLDRYIEINEFVLTTLNDFK